MEISGDGVGMRFYGEHKKFAGFTSVYEESTDDDVASMGRLAAFAGGAQGDHV